MIKNSHPCLWKIKQLTSKFGIYQHGNQSSFDPKFGYALEDQSRALIVSHKFQEEKLKKIYLDYIIKSKTENGLLYHYFYEDGRGFEEGGRSKSSVSNEEAYGITLWALFSTGHFKDGRIREIVEKLKDNAFSWSSPRAIAAAIIGLSELPEQTPLELKLIKKLHVFFRETVADDWHWFENYLTYANAIMPWAMWQFAFKRGDLRSLEVAEQSTRFLIDVCQIGGIPAPIGNRGWFWKGGRRAIYDQQPIDAAYMVCCLEKAYLATKNHFYLSWAEKWWRWFLGENIKKTSLIDKNFACFDALTSQGVNFNQGAESNICFLLAYLSAQKLGFINPKNNSL